MAISEKMHVSKQTRRLGQAATERFPLGQGNPPNREAFLSIRLWNTGENGETVPLYWDSGAAAVCLTADVIAASEGQPVSSDSGVLVTSFHSDHLAISAARRLQWAIQGFSENTDLQGISVAVLVHSAEELSTGSEGDALRGALDQATGGQILLTEKASQFFEDLPGFASQTLDGTGLRELQWRSPESNSTRVFDEQWLTNYIQQHGLEEQLSEAPPPAVAPDAPWKADSSAEDERGPGSMFSNPKMLWIIGGVCAAALAVGAVLYFTRSGDKQSTQVVDTHPTPTNPTAPSAGGGQTTGEGNPTSPDPGHTPQIPTQGHHPDNPPPPDKPGHLRNDLKHPRENQPGTTPPVTPQVPPTDTPPVVPPKEIKDRSGCNLERDQWDLVIQAGWKSYNKADYGRAVKQFGSVLACDPGNGKAKEGFDRARGAMAEGSRDN